jgi:ATP-grasp domain, R2K clade family 3
MINAPNSMLFWYPKIKNIGIRQPKTEMIKLIKEDRFFNDIEIENIASGNYKDLDPFMNKIYKKAKKIGYPLFLRTDEISGKHSWKNTCYVTEEKNLKEHIRRLFEETTMINGIWPQIGLKGIILREYIPMNTLFTAFYGEMPVNPEIRAFIWNGEVVCAHWYWIKEAIIRGTPKDKLPGNWEYLIDHSIATLGNSMKKILLPAIKVAKIFNHYWSVDFCQATNGDWVLIDMATGEKSWHPDCKINDKILKRIKDIKDGKTNSYELD